MVYPDATRACPNCETSGATPLPRYSRKGWIVAACDACKFVYLKNPPEYAELIDEMAWEKTYKQEVEYRNKRAPVAQKINRATRFRLTAFRKDRMKNFVRLLSGGEILDIGCGNGKRMGPPFTPYGIELSHALWEQADAHMRGLGGSCMHSSGAEGVWKYPAENSTPS